MRVKDKIMKIYILLEVRGNCFAVSSYGFGEEVTVLGTFSSEDKAKDAGALYVNKPHARWWKKGCGKILSLDNCNKHYHFLQVLCRELDSPVK